MNFKKLRQSALRHQSLLSAPECTRTQYVEGKKQFSLKGKSSILTRSVLIPLARDVGSSPVPCEMGVTRKRDVVLTRFTATGFSLRFGIQPVPFPEPSTPCRSPNLA